MNLIELLRPQLSKPEKIVVFKVRGTMQITRRRTPVFTLGSFKPSHYTNDLSLVTIEIHEDFLKIDEIIKFINKHGMIAIENENEIVNIVSMQNVQYEINPTSLRIIASLEEIEYIYQLGGPFDVYAYPRSHTI